MFVDVEGDRTGHAAWSLGPSPFGRRSVARNRPAGPGVRALRGPEVRWPAPMLSPAPKSSNRSKTRNGASG